jgi:hypothetical protein
MKYKLKIKLFEISFNGDLNTKAIVYFFRLFTVVDENIIQ